MNSNFYLSVAGNLMTLVIWLSVILLIIVFMFHKSNTKSTCQFCKISVSSSDAKYMMTVNLEFVSFKQPWASIHSV